MCDKKRLNRINILFFSLLLGYILVWWFASLISKPALDAYGDMVENYAWGQTWMWGSFKHPPLIAWVVKLWFSVFPTTVASYFLLSYVNATIGLLGIVALGRLWLPQALSINDKKTFAFVVLLLALLSAPYSNLAAKFNADTILLSIWPWATYAFFRAIHAEKRHEKLTTSLLLGLLGAVAVLGKYYSGVLLTSFVLVSFLCRHYWAWYKTPYPYIAVLSFALFLTPHFLWEFGMNFPFMHYMAEKINTHFHFKKVFSFLLSGIYFLPFTWLAWLLLYRKLSSGADKKTPRLSIPIKPLILICLLPAVITVSLHFILHIHLTAHWAIPIWFALPILLAIKLLPYINRNFPYCGVWRSLLAWGGVVLCLAFIYTFFLSAKGDAKYTYSRQAMVATIQNHFSKRFPNRQLGWAGGVWTSPAALAFFAPNHPRAIPGFPNQMPGLVNPHPTWKSEYGVIICINTQLATKAEGLNKGCAKDTKKWLKDNNLPMIEARVNFQASGWRFLKPVAKVAQLFWVPPKGGRNE